MSEQIVVNWDSGQESFFNRIEANNFINGVCQKIAPEKEYVITCVFSY